MPFEFPLEVDTKDQIPEKYLNFYKEVDGKFHLDDEDLKSRIDNSALQKAIEKQRKINKENENKIERWTKLGKSPEEIQELLDKAKKKGSKDDDDGDVDSRIAQALAAKDKEFEPVKEELTTIKGKYANKIVGMEAQVEIAAAKGSSKLLLPVIREFTEVVEEDGEFVVRVIDEKGEPRVNSKGEFLTVKDLIAELKKSEDYGRAFEGSGASGGGSQQSTGKGQNTDWQKLSPKERLKFAHGNKKK